MKGFVIPLCVTIVIAGLLGMAGWRIWIRNDGAHQEVSRETNKGANSGAKVEVVRPAADETATEIEKARDRLLLRDSESPDSGN